MLTPRIETIIQETNDQVDLAKVSELVQTRHNLTSNWRKLVNDCYRKKKNL